MSLRNIILIVFSLLSNCAVFAQALPDDIRQHILLVEELSLEEYKNRKMDFLREAKSQRKISGHWGIEQLASNISERKYGDITSWRIKKLRKSKLRYRFFRNEDVDKILAEKPDAFKYKILTSFEVKQTKNGNSLTISVDYDIFNLNNQQIGRIRQNEFFKMIRRMDN